MAFTLMTKEVFDELEKQGIINGKGFHLSGRLHHHIKDLHSINKFKWLSTDIIEEPVSRWDLRENSCMTLVSCKSAKNSHIVPPDEDVIIGLFNEKKKTYFGLNASNPGGGWTSLPNVRHLMLPQ
ncbi:uncharacterized protein FPRO_07155 [Fusarium proliferatum ET1]|uniref:Uncharacterized protein n=1 Tax=Fusarium proliferatum (strain ET1) TaxID=1227346 RepID=A0A1L7VBK8_FUSPR|nr:uncharacterized protein FPRO_07155 [Fusarium proliferatum ET1]CZR37654.1 uncharacterized protein FPRO_07155 [Fusarium proliferatum ET1]